MSLRAYEWPVLVALTLCTRWAHLCALWPRTIYWFCSKDVRVNPCLLSSNKSGWHLSTYIDLIKGRKRVVLVHKWLWIWPRAAKRKAFSSTRRANSLHQFSLKVGVLLLDNFEICWICQGWSHQVRKFRHFNLWVSYGKLLDVKQEIMASNK